MKLVVLTLLSVIYHCNAYSGGAPEEVCNDMTPQHPVSPQKSQLPYKVSVSKNQIKAGETVEIEVSGGEYKGLLVEVRNGDKAVGEFIVSESDRYYKTINCHGNKNVSRKCKIIKMKRNICLIYLTIE